MGRRLSQIFADKKQKGHNAGGKLYGCRMAMDMMHLEKEDLSESVDDIIGAMEFMEMSEGAQIIFI